MLIGPFTQIITMDNLAPRGHLSNDDLVILNNGGIRVKEGIIEEIGDFEEMRFEKHDDIIETPAPSVALPGLIDAHTLLCFAGSRAHEYNLRLSGCSYEEIAEQGGGILDTVKQTRATSEQELSYLVTERVSHLLNCGVTTTEVKSGYGLSVEEEIKQLRVINEAGKSQPITIIPTCFAAHAKPWEFVTAKEYLDYLIKELFPKIGKLTKRIDILVDDVAFTVDQAQTYLQAAIDAGFDITLGCEMTSHGGAKLAAKLKSVSASHLDGIDDDDAAALSNAGTHAIVLPNTSLGLGSLFPPAKKLLDHDVSLAIASGFNPGTAPMGDLITGAALMGISEKLTQAETLAGITCRAATALKLTDRGILKVGQRADIVSFPCEEYQEILYHQGAMRPNGVFVGGECVISR